MTDRRRPRPPKRVIAHSSGDDRLPPIRRSLGQHFLTDRSILERIARAVGATKQDTLVEVGPGRGALTDHLVDRAGQLVAIEYDRALAARLRERYKDHRTVRVVEADVLAAPLNAVAGTDDYLLVGNVPYYITTPILFHALERPRARRSVFLVQREVADRLAAAPGTRSYGALSVNVQAVATVERLFRVPAGAFQPPPRVESAVVRVTPRNDPVIRPDEEEAFRTFVQSVFSFRRKQMRRVLRSVRTMSADAADAILASAYVDPDARPETLSPTQLAALLRVTAGTV